MRKRCNWQKGTKQEKISSEKPNRNYVKFNLFRATNHKEFKKYSEISALPGLKKIKYYQGSHCGPKIKFVSNPLRFT